MGFFSFFFPKAKQSAPSPSTIPELERLFPERADHLGRAAVVEQRAKAAVAARRYDDAWRLLHEQKEHYRRHAKSYGMTAAQTVALDGSVHANLANIRRLEGKHDDALVHLLYCVISGGVRPAGEKKARVYFRRCKFPQVSEEQLAEFLTTSTGRPDLPAIQERVRDWRDA